MKFKIFLVVLILSAQIAGIFCVSRAREREWQNNPTFRLECATYDPRDFLRGHYLPLRFKIEDAEIPFSKFDVPAQKKLRKALGNEIVKLFTGERESVYERLPDDWEFWAILAPNAQTGFWEIERVTLDNPKIDFNANSQAGKIALKSRDDRFWLLKRPIRASAQTTKNPEDFFTAGSPFEINVPLYFSFPNRRFYLPERKAKEFDEKYRGNTQHVISAELFFRADGSIVPKRLFIDGEEF